MVFIERPNNYLEDSVRTADVMGIGMNFDLMNEI